jgi:hypothetical protein
MRSHPASGRAVSMLSRPPFDVATAAFTSDVRVTVRRAHERRWSRFGRDVRCALYQAGERFDFCVRGRLRVTRGIDVTHYGILRDAGIEAGSPPGTRVPGTPAVCEMVLGTKGKQKGKPQADPSLRDTEEG